MPNHTQAPNTFGTVPQQFHVIPYVNAQAAAEYLGFSPAKVKRMAREGVLPAHPLNDGKRRYWRFVLHELSEWLLRRSNQGVELG